LRYGRGLDLAVVHIFRHGGVHHFNVFLILLFFVFDIIFIIPYALKIGFGDRRPD
jgi:hypothetical protein